MTTAKKIAAALALLLAVGGGSYWLGRRSVPTRVAESQVSDGRRDASWGSTATMAKSTTTARSPSTLRRYDPKTGALVSELVTGAVTSSSTTAATAASGGQEHEQSHIEAKRAVEYGTAPRLRLSLGLGYDSKRLDLRPVASVGAELRLTPPIFGVAAWAYGTVAPPVAVPVLSNRAGIDWTAGIKLQGEW